MEVLGGALRGMGKSITTMVISLLGACAFRILWVKTVLPLFPVVECVYLSYPISWFLVVVCNAIFLIVEYQKLAHPKLSPKKTSTMSEIAVP
jgi:Na+-driven multidrug efflux pump